MCVPTAGSHTPPYHTTKICHLIRAAGHDAGPRHNSTSASAGHDHCAASLIAVGTSVGTGPPWSVTQHHRDATAPLAARIKRKEASFLPSRASAVDGGLLSAGPIHTACPCARPAVQ
eukprot:357523-Chlamydomonas_euryale.AAC.13